MKYKKQAMRRGTAKGKKKEINQRRNEKCGSIAPLLLKGDKLKLKKSI